MSNINETDIDKLLKLSINNKNKYYAINKGGNDINEDKYIEYIIEIIKTFIKEKNNINLAEMGKYIKKEVKYKKISVRAYLDDNILTGERNVNNFIKKKFGSLKKLYEIVKNQ